MICRGKTFWLICLKIIAYVDVSQISDLQAYSDFKSLSSDSAPAKTKLMDFFGNTTNSVSWASVRN